MDKCRASLFLFSLVILSVAASAQNANSFGARRAADSETPATCSNATLTGNYGLLLAGSDNNSNLVAEVGQITANGKGKIISGRWTKAISGSYQSMTLSGTYSIGANCAGQATITPQGQPSLTLSVLVVAAGAHFDMIVTENGYTESGYADAQGDAVCSDAGISGNWAWVQTNAFVVGVGLGAYTAQVSLKGNGSVSFNGTYSVNGSIQQTQSTGTYTIGTKCTGTINLNGNVSNFVLAGGGKEMFVMSETPSIVGWAIGER